MVVAAADKFFGGMEANRRGGTGDYSSVGAGGHDKGGGGGCGLSGKRTRKGAKCRDEGAFGRWAGITEGMVRDCSRAEGDGGSDKSHGKEQNG